MTTTTPHSPGSDPSQGPGSGGRREGDNRASGRPARGGSKVWIAVAVVAVVVIAALGWLFTAGPLSSSSQTERDIEQTLTDMSTAESFEAFNEYMCAENRVPQDLVETITNSGEQTGTDLDVMFRESIAGTLPENLEVTGVELGGDGSEATATVESGNDDEQAVDEVFLRKEDGDWKVCQTGVGMGSVPQEGQPG
ncbi:Rv0361 family membrane protein [Dietzia aerolata]|uniref:DUF4878 domain-containing protein n=1 Tax=Dietzia aerolata TaxID=595984 RepID=A0ABV5JQK6_9ACTN|nr:hypothetical protein [Dietzia aerolata]